MASGNAVKKKEGVKKKNIAARSKTRGRSKASAKKSLNNEVQGIILIALGLLLLVSLIMGQSAVVPKAVSGFLFGAFGLFAYVVPVMLIVWGVFRILLKKVTLHGGKIASSIAFVLSVIGILHCIMTDVFQKAPDYWAAIADTYAAQAGMGAMATLYVYPLFALFDTVATYIIFAAIIAITLILLFNFSYKEAGEQVKRTFNAFSEQAAVRHAERQAEKEAEKQRQPVEMFDDIIEKEHEEPVKKQEKERKKGKKIKESESIQEENIFGAAGPITVRHYDEDFIDYTMPEIPPETSVTETTPSVNGEEKALNEPPDYQELEEPEALKAAEAVKATEVKPAEAMPASNQKGLEQMPKPVYKFPPVSLLNLPAGRKQSVKTNYNQNAMRLVKAFASFGIKTEIADIAVGPAITRYELTVEQGTRVSRILALADDIALAMAAVGVRIEAPIPGKSAIGVEIPNESVSMVTLREVLDTEEFRSSKSCVSIALGKDITGKAIIVDIAKMPHLLIAGQTGSGKSVAINSLITSILYKASPEEVRLILVDPKQVELSIYNGIPNLLLPVVTDPKKAAGALQYVVRTMENRYSEFNRKKVKDIMRYNEVCRQNGEAIMYRIVVIVDELNDLMMVCPGEVEDSVMRIAQLARAAGIYLVLATQRPSVNVITGVIKANIPSRMAFAVSSSHDSKTILDRVGAEKLVGRGDMLYHHNGDAKPMRIQGAYIDETEVERIVQFIKDSASEPEYIDEECIDVVESKDGDADDGSGEDMGYDELIFKAIETVMEGQQASISLLQRKLGVGYARAGRLIDAMENMRIIGPSQGSKPREILITYEQYIQNYKKKF